MEKKQSEKHQRKGKCDYQSIEHKKCEKSRKWKHRDTSDTSYVNSSESEVEVVKQKKHKVKKVKKCKVSETETEQSLSSEEKPVKPHKKVMMSKLRCTGKQKSSKKKPIVGVPMDEWKAVMDFVQ